MSARPHYLRSFSQEHPAIRVAVLSEEQLHTAALETRPGHYHVDTDDCITKRFPRTSAEAFKGSDYGAAFENPMPRPIRWQYVWATVALFVLFVTGSSIAP